MNEPPANENSFGGKVVTPGPRTIRANGTRTRAKFRVNIINQTGRREQRRGKKIEKKKKSQTRARKYIFITASRRGEGPAKIIRDYVQQYC